MKKVASSILTIIFIVFSTFSFSQTGTKKSSKSHHSGTYKSGKGSSHKGGKYKNSSTNNHYKKRK